MTTLTGMQRLEEADQSSARVCAVLDLASLHATEAFERPDDDLEEFIDDLLESRYKVHPSVKPLREIALKAYEGELQELGYLLCHRNLLGFAVKFSTPVMTKTGKTSWSFSWGYTQSTWVYAESYDAAWKLGIAWAEQCRKRAKPAPKPKKEAAHMQQPDGVPALMEVRAMNNVEKINGKLGVRVEQTSDAALRFAIGVCPNGWQWSFTAAVPVEGLRMIRDCINEVLAATDGVAACTNVRNQSTPPHGVKEVPRG